MTVLRSLVSTSQRFRLLRGSGAKAVLELCDDGGKAGAVPASGEMPSDLCLLSCGALSIKHDRQRPASALAHAALEHAQLVPVRAGARTAALSRRRSRSSQEPLRCSPPIVLLERPSRASSECIAAWARPTRSSCRSRTIS